MAKGVEWRLCSRHLDVDPDVMWGCPDCVAELRHALTAAIRERDAKRAERDRLRAALHEAATRLERCAIVAGSDPEFAAIAVQGYRDLLASTTEGS